MERNCTGQRKVTYTNTEATQNGQDDSFVPAQYKAAL